MFSRASSTAHIYLRCQFRLFRPSGPVHLLSFPRASSIPRRYQSAAAVLVDDGENHLEPTDSISAENLTRSIQGERRKQKGKLSKRWRPSRTAHLGMDALGKPSEVLLLSPRDRKIPIAPTESGEELKENFYESLKSEKEPPSWEHVKENIDQTRQQLSQQRGKLDEESWSKLKSALSQGFNRTQLQQYLKEAYVSPKQQPLKHGKEYSKMQLVRLIASRLWHYELPSQPVQVKEPSPSGEVSLPAYSLRARTVFERSPSTRKLTDAAEARGVNITFHASKTSVVGPQDKIRFIANQLQKQMKSIKTNMGQDECLELSRLLKINQDCSESLDILVESLALKYGCHASIVKKPFPKLDVVTTRSNAGAIDRLRHELCLALETEKSRTPCLLSLPSTSITLVPYYSPDVSSRYPYRKDLKRACAAQNSKVPLELPLHRLADQICQRLASQEPSGSEQIEYVAHFGVVLTRTGTADMLGKLDKEKSEQIMDITSTFVPEVSGLPYLLGNPKFSIARNERLPAFTAIVRLSPRSRLASQPTIELAVTGSDPLAGLAQNLSIESVRIIREDATAHLLVPSLPVDIRFIRRTNVDIYKSSKPDSSSHPELVTALDDYLKAVTHKQKLNQTATPAPQLALFPDLILPGAFLPPAAPPKNSKLPPAQYILSDFSIIDVDNRIFHVAQQTFALEHVNYIAQNPNESPHTGTVDPSTVVPSPFRDRQELVMTVRMPLKGDHGEEATHGKEKKKKKKMTYEEEVEMAEQTESQQFRSFVKAAMYVANQIDGEARRLRYRMEGMK